MRLSIVTTIAIVAIALSSTVALARDDTKIPDIKGCSDGQKSRLKHLWREAHEAVWKAERLITEIGRLDDSARQAFLWARDDRGDLASASPQTYFGKHSGHDYAKIVLQALRKAERRFRGGGGAGVLKIKTLRCGQPIARSRDEHVDVCPANGTGGVPPAYHVPAGTIVTCPAFWNDQNNQFLDERDKVYRAVRTLVHEVFHYLSIDACPTRRVDCNRYIKDHHGRGPRIGGNTYYYGEDVIRLAKIARQYAVRVPDSYAWFATNVHLGDLQYQTVWRRPVPASGTRLPPRRPQYKIDMTWSGLKDTIERKKNRRHLADIETYVRAGQRQYSGLWLPGGRETAVARHESWQAFVDNWNAVRDRYELIDLEVYPVGDGHHYLGLYVRNPRPGRSAALFRLPWNRFVEQWETIGNHQYLADVEITQEGGDTLYYGLWRLKDDDRPRGALFRNMTLDELVQRFDTDLTNQELVDLEQTREDGQYRFLAVWRNTGRKTAAVWVFDRKFDHDRTWRGLADDNLWPADFDVWLDYAHRFVPDQ